MFSASELVPTDREIDPVQLDQDHEVLDLMNLNPAFICEYCADLKMGATDAQTHLQIIETLEFWRHDLKLLLHLSELPAGMKITATSDRKVRTIIQSDYRKIMPTGPDPVWWNSTPDALLTKIEPGRKARRIIVEATVSNSSTAKHDKYEKYKDLAEGIGADLHVYASMPNEQPITMAGNVKGSDLYDTIIHELNEVWLSASKLGLTDQINKLRHGLKTRDTSRDMSAIDRLQYIPMATGAENARKHENPFERVHRLRADRDLGNSKAAMLPDVKPMAWYENTLYDDIATKAMENPVIEDTSDAAIERAYNDASDAMEVLYNGDDPNKNTLNFTFSSSQISNHNKERDQAANILNILSSSVHIDIRDMAEVCLRSMDDEDFKPNHSNAGAFKSILKKAKVKPFWDKKGGKEESQRKAEKMEKKSSWLPGNANHIEEALRLENEMTKLDRPQVARFGFKCPYEQWSSEVTRSSSLFGNKIISLTNETTSGAMCRYASAMAQKIMHIKRSRNYKIDLWTGGFSSNLFIKLPTSTPVSDTCTVPFISVSVGRERSEIISLVNTMYEEVIIHNNERYIVHITFPQRLFVRQFSQWLTADLDLILLCGLLAKPSIESQEPVFGFPVGAIAVCCLSQHISLTYLLENLRYIGQLSLSSYSSIGSFIKEKMISPLKSPFELSVWLKSQTWAKRLNQKKPRGAVRVSINENTIETDVNNINFDRYPSIFMEEGMFNLPDLLNQLFALLMLRKKNQHDPVQGLSSGYFDLTMLQLDFKGDKDMNVMDMTTSSKFTYDSRYVKEATKNAMNNYYEPKLNILKANFMKSGSFDSHGHIANNRGSREEQVGESGFIRSTTNIQESLKYKDEPTVCDVASYSDLSNNHFEYAQKQQRGADRLIGVTSFPMRCQLKVAEDLARSHNKLLPNEAISKSGEIKVRIMQNKLNDLLVSNEEMIKKGRATLLLLSADNTKHSEHDALEKYSVSWAQEERMLPQGWANCVHRALALMRRRRVFLPEAVWKHNQAVIDHPSEDKIDFSVFWGKNKSKPFPGGWVQGMFNNVSTKLHAEAQLLAAKVIEHAMGRKIAFTGDTHSDDSWMGVLIDVYKNEDVSTIHRKVMNVYYWCMQAAGFRLNRKKTFGSTCIVEFLSRYLVLDDQVSTHIKSGISVISDLPCRGPGIDFAAAYGKVMQYLRDGGYLCMTQLMLTLGRRQVMKMYSMLPGQVNDVTTLGVRETNIPIQIGGHCMVPPVTLMMWGPKVSNLILMNRFKDLSSKEQSCLYSCMPLIQGENTGVRDAIGRLIDQGWRGPVNKPFLKKSIIKARSLIDGASITDAENLLKEHPVLKYEKPRSHKLLMRFLNALLLDKDYAMGLNPVGGMAMILRVARSIREKAWRWGDEYITLREWLLASTVATVNREAFESIMNCYANSAIQNMLSIETSLGISMPSQVSRMAHRLIQITPTYGERLVRESIGSLLMYEYDIDLFRKDERNDDLSLEWFSQIELVKTVRKMLKGILPNDQEIAVVQGILQQDKYYKVFASLPRMKNPTPLDMIRSLYTYSFYPDIHFEVDITSDNLGPYLSPVFRQSHSMGLQKAGAALVGTLKWVVSTDVKPAIHSLLYDVNYHTPSDGDLTCDQLITRILNSASCTRAMKDDVAVVRAYKEHGLNKFADQSIVERFKKANKSSMTVEQAQKRGSKGTWSGPGRVSVTTGKFYTAIDFNGTLGHARNALGTHRLKSAKIVTNHKQPLILDMAMHKLERYFKLNTSEMFTIFGEASTGLITIQHRGGQYWMSERGNGGNIDWLYDPQSKGPENPDRVMSYYINPFMNLYADVLIRHSGKQSSYTVRTTNTWSHVNTSGVIDWKDTKLTLANGSVAVSLSNLDKVKSLHNLSTDPRLDFNSLRRIVKIRYDDYSPESIFEVFKHCVNQLKKDFVKMDEENRVIARTRLPADVEPGYMLEDAISRALEEEAIDASDVFLEGLQDTYDEFEDDNEEEDDNAFRSGLIEVAGFGYQTGFSVSPQFVLNLAVASALGVTTKQDQEDVWPVMGLIINYLSVKEDKIGFYDTWVDAQDAYPLMMLRDLKTVAAGMASYSYTEPMTESDLRQRLRTQPALLEITRKLMEGKTNQVPRLLIAYMRRSPRPCYHMITVLFKGLVEQITMLENDSAPSELKF